MKVGGEIMGIENFNYQNPFPEPYSFKEEEVEKEEKKEEEIKKFEKKGEPATPQFIPKENKAKRKEEKKTVEPKKSKNSSKETLYHKELKKKKNEILEVKAENFEENLEEEHERIKLDAIREQELKGQTYQA